MPLSEVDIYNYALAHIGWKKTITSATEDSTERELATRFYAQARDQALRDWDWPFARTFVALTDLGSPPAQWTCRYQYPADAVAIRFIVAGDKKSTTEQIPFEVAYYPAASGVLCVLTDQASAVAAYTRLTTDTSLFDTMFTEALSLLLAAKLAVPITGNGRLMSAVLGQYAQAIQNARQTTLSERYGDPERNAESDNDLTATRFQD